jgi:hypothetical protein
MLNNNLPQINDDDADQKKIEYKERLHYSLLICVLAVNLRLISSAVPFFHARNRVLVLTLRPKSN